MASDDYDGGNTTGFISPAGDALEGPTDLSIVLDLRRPHRYPVRVAGEALRERGIFPGDILITDAAAPPASGRVCVAFVHGDVWLATLAFRHGQWWLRPSAAGRVPGGSRWPSAARRRYGPSSAAWYGRTFKRAPVPATFGLIDGNSFYCSCERAFSPRLRGRAVVVLSNNDGFCAIARTSEAKAAGIKMGDPWHKARGRPEVRAARVEWLSSNYALYGDMSRRMYQVLAGRVPRVEPYSIDEMFLDLDVPGDVLALAGELRAAVRRVAKIPTCVGIGPTKTVAKLANALAKAHPVMEGVCDLRGEAERARWYERLPVSEVWGIGGRTAEKLAATGITTIARFLAMPGRDARTLLTVVGARVQAELQGVSCLPLSMMAATRKGVAVTRSFGRPVTQWADMREATAHHAARAGEKLRAEGLVAGRMMVFLHTNPHNGDPWHSAQHGGRIEATADTGALIGEAVRMLRPLWRQGHRYLKVGVMLDDLRDADAEPRSLFPTRDPVRSARLMATLDAVNARHGRGTVRPLATGVARSWGTRRSHLSPRYTTQVAELMEAEAW